MTVALRRLTDALALAALAAWAVALGRWLRAPDPGASLMALLLTGAVAAVALRRVYGPRGVASLRQRGVAPMPDDGRVDLNRAGREELQRLPGIGPVVAERIVEDRTVRGPFASVEELARVPGLGPARIRALAGQARART